MTETGSSDAADLGAPTWTELVLGHLTGSSRPAIVDRGLEWTGDELLARAGGASAWLDELSVPRGAAVPTLVDESAAAVALVVGGACSGRPIAPLGTRLPPHELVEAVRALGSRVLVADPELRSVAEAIAAASGTSVHVLDPESPSRSTLPDAASDVVAVIHTSGTTGQPKPVPLRQAPLVAAGRDLRARDRDGRGRPVHVGLSVLPHRGARDGARRARSRDDTDPDAEVRPRRVQRRVAELEPTHALLVPTMIDVLLAEGLLDAARLRVLQYGAAPIHPGTLADALAALPHTRMVQIFGQTEVSPITVLGHEDHLAALGGRPELLASVGRAVPEVELRIDEPDADGVGELVVRAPHVFVADPDGWRRTGDLGRVAPDGYVFLRGRRHDRIVRGGENIYPTEVEACSRPTPPSRRSWWSGCPIRRWGEIVKAVVVPRAEPPTVGDLQAYARDRIAPFKVPAVVEFVDELPADRDGQGVATGPRNLTGSSSSG